MKWIKVSDKLPKKKGEYTVRSIENGVKRLLLFSGTHFYKIGNGFQSTQFEWLDKTSYSQEHLDLLNEVIPVIDQLINSTPTGERRNYLCDLRIKVGLSVREAFTY